MKALNHALWIRPIDFRTMEERATAEDIDINKYTSS